MSTNTNRAKLKNVITNREYKRVIYDDKFPMYWEECITMYPQSGLRNTNRVSPKLMSYQVRMYKTWKHNRLTQWK